MVIVTSEVEYLKKENKRLKDFKRKVCEALNFDIEFASDEQIIKAIIIANTSAYEFREARFRIKEKLEEKGLDTRPISI